MDVTRLAPLPIWALILYQNVWMWRETPQRRREATKRMNADLAAYLKEPHTEEAKSKARMLGGQTLTRLDRCQRRIFHDMFLQIILSGFGSIAIYALADPFFLALTFLVVFISMVALLWDAWSCFRVFDHVTPWR